MPNTLETEIKGTARVDLGIIGIGGTVKRKVITDYKPQKLWSWRAFFGLQEKEEKEENAQATDEELIRDIVARAGEYKVPDLSAYAVNSYWKTLEEQAKITTVISGKGGVGKTSIALGLTEHYSSFENVLVVDFDLHNRGLTSKYGKLTPDRSTVLSEMARFRRLVLSDERLPRDAGKVVLAKIESELFHDLRSRYAYNSYPHQSTRFPLKMEHLYLESVRERKFPDGSRPSNCYFLPSRRGGESFLGSEESRFDVAETAIFLTYLAHLAHKNGIGRIVLDCHGAHDLFMVGAILASEHLVIVTKPEPAAFEGTIELVRFARTINRTGTFYWRLR